MARKKKATQEASRKKKRPAVPPPFIDHTWWELLGIDWLNPEDPPTEHSLGTAYRQKAIKVHPDKHLERKAEYEAEFKKLNAEVVGVSVDSAHAHLAWCVRRDAPLSCARRRSTRLGTSAQCRCSVGAI